MQRSENRRPQGLAVRVLSPATFNPPLSSRKTHDTFRVEVFKFPLINLAVRNRMRGQFGLRGGPVSQRLA